MNPAAVQLRLDPVLPVDPVEVSRLSTPERGRLYDALDLDGLQIAAVEEAVRLILRGEYLRSGR